MEKSSPKNLQRYSSLHRLLQLLPPFYLWIFPYRCSHPVAAKRYEERPETWSHRSRLARSTATCIRRTNRLLYYRSYPPSLQSYLTHTIRDGCLERRTCWNPVAAI